MRWIIPTILLGLSAQAAEPQTAACAKCEARIQLDEQRWNCLVGRLDEFERSPTPILIFTLADAACRTRGAGVNISAGAGVNISAGSSQTSKVFLLSKDQVACLKQRRGEVQRTGDLYQFDFAQRC